MTTNRITNTNNLDNINRIRVIAMVLVIIDHYCCIFGNETLTSVALLLGRVAVSIFFSISAYIYGVKWRESGFQPINIRHFFTKRLSRIYVPLWIAMVLILPIEYIVQNHLDFKTIVFNVFGLGWFYPLFTAGHLWFITMLVILYFAIVFFSILRLDKIKSFAWYILFFCVTIVYICGDKLSLIGNSWIPIQLMTACILFYKGDVLERIISCHRLFFFTSALFLFVLIVSISIIKCDCFFSIYPLELFSSSVVGSLLFLTMLIGFPNKTNNRLIKILSKYSYTIYLVHYPSLLLSLYLISNKWITTLVWICLTFVFILVTQYFTRSLQNHIKLS